MRKYIYAIIALAAVVLSSCSNDDIDVTYTQQLTYNVSPQHPYDAYNNMTEYMKSYVLSGDFGKDVGKDMQLGIFTFIYDEDGNLVLADSTRQRTFDQVSRTYNLTDGIYTAITVEMVVDEDYRGRVWFLAGRDELSTLEVRKDTTVQGTYLFDMIGSIATNIQVGKEKLQTISVEPEPVGSRIQFMTRNFDKYNNSYYQRMCFFTHEEPIGRYLSPERTGNDKYRYASYGSIHQWEYRCGISRPWNGEDAVSIYLLESGDINYCIGLYHEGSLNFLGFPTTSGSGIQSDWGTQLTDTYTGTHLTVNEGDWRWVGFNYSASNGISVSDFATRDELNEWFSQFVEPVAVPDAKPYLTWGASASTVYTYMTNSGMSFFQDETDSTEYTASYYNPDRTLRYYYNFDLTQNNLNSVTMRYSKTDYAMSDILAALNNEYTFSEQTSSGDYIFTSANTFVGAYENNNYIYVIYLAMGSSAKKKNFLGESKSSRFR